MAFRCTESLTLTDTSLNTRESLNSLKMQFIKRVNYLFISLDTIEKNLQFSHNVRKNYRTFIAMFALI